MDTITVYSPLSTSDDLVTQLKDYQQGSFLTSSGPFARTLTVTDSSSLRSGLECYFAEVAREGTILDPVSFLDRLATRLPLDKLEQAVRLAPYDALTESKAMLEEAQAYMALTKGVSPSLSDRVASAVEAITTVIESTVATFGFIDAFKPSDSDMHAQVKSEKVLMMLSAFGMVFSALVPVLGINIAVLLVCGVLGTILVLGVLWPRLRPLPTHLPANAENWTQQMRSANFVGQGRKQSLNEIANIMKMGRHALLVGPSRVGKSLTAKAFAHAVARGDYPELRGKVVFRINTTDLVGQTASFLGGGNTVLNKISAAMGRHRDNVILVLDEVHMACKNGERIADQLKTFLDKGGEFPHVIGISTHREYEEHIKNNQAFSLRFDVVDIKNTDRAETLKILAEEVIRNTSRPLIKDSVLEKIYEMSSVDKSAPQPSTSLRLLHKCISRTSETQQSAIEQQITAVSDQILSLRTQAAASRGRRRATVKEINALEQEVHNLRARLATEQSQSKKLFRAKELLDQVTEQTYGCVQKICASAGKSFGVSTVEKQLKMFILLHEFLAPALRSFVEDSAQQIGIKVVIDETMLESSFSSQE